MDTRAHVYDYRAINKSDKIIVRARCVFVSHPDLNYCYARGSLSNQQFRLGEVRLCVSHT